MKRLFLRILLIINLITALFLIISSLSVYISPEDIWIFAFIGLAYPFILLVNLAFIVFWLFVKKKYSLLSVFVIILSWNQLQKFVQINLHRQPVPTQRPIAKVLSYNVRLFNYYQWLKDASVPNNILKFIQSEKSDIICLQEFLTIDNSRFSVDSIKYVLKNTAFPHIYFSHVIPGNRSFGIATFSSYPIVNKGVIKFENSPNVSIFTDLKINNDTVRVYNCHLQSTRLRKDDYHLLDSLLLNYDNKQLNNFKDLTLRLRDAFVRRARQVDKLSEHIRNSPYPAIICGDFNDTPVSYTYRKLKGDFDDAYLESGSGIGNTYFGNFPSFRIDYILHDKNITTFDFDTKKVKWSDHYPIVCDFYVN